MKRILIIFVLVIIFILVSCTEQGGTSGGGSGSSGGSSENVESNVICDKSMKVLPIDKPIVMKIKERLSFGRMLYAVYPAAVNPVTALENYTYDGIYYSQNTHDYPDSIKYNVIETFDTIAEMAKKGVIVTPQTVVAMFRVTLTHYSENSNALWVYVRAKGSSDEWKFISLSGVGTDYVFVETNSIGELEYYVEESSHYNWVDDEFCEPGFTVPGWVEAHIEVERVYEPFE